MVSNHDLLEAQAYERRRLVSAFLYGPRELEASSGVRPVVAGLVLAALVVGVAAVLRLLSL